MALATEMSSERHLCNATRYPKDAVERRRLPIEFQKHPNWNRNTYHNDSEVISPQRKTTMSTITPKFGESRKLISRQSPHFSDSKILMPTFKYLKSYAPMLPHHSSYNDGAYHARAHVFVIEYIIIISIRIL